MFRSRTRYFAPRSSYADHFDLFNRLMNQSSRNDMGGFPAFNVWANEDGAVVTSELPGVKFEDLDITVSGKGINVKGARKEGADQDGRYLRRERPEGEFTRSIELPFQIEASKVDAKMANGVLCINLPRAENDKPRKITVGA